MGLGRIAAAALALGVSGSVPRADTPAPFPDFQARRVTPPKPGATRRITVQIDPATPGRAETGEGPSETVGKEVGAGRYGWFWDGLPGETGPARLRSALEVLSGAQEVAAPRLQALQEIARTRGIPILKATVGTRVSPALVLAVIAVESGGRADAVSAAGAQGLMQLMPDTAARFGVTDSFAAEANIEGGVKYLDWLMREFGDDPILVLAGYNAGAGAVRDHGGVPPFAETRDYVPKVLAAFRLARGLCMTPPELLSDGCVFAALN